MAIVDGGRDALTEYRVVRRYDRFTLVKRHFLHAARLGFTLPPAGLEWREFESPLPDDLQAALDVI